MDDSPAGSHPLEIAGANLSLVSLEVLVVEGSFEHVGNCLEAPMRMVGEPSRQLDLEEVHHKEGAEIRQPAVS